jgi:hypothetical protein
VLPSLFPMHRERCFASRSCCIAAEEEICVLYIQCLFFFSPPTFIQWPAMTGGGYNGYAPQDAAGQSRGSECAGQSRLLKNESCWKQLVVNNLIAAGSVRRRPTGGFFLFVGPGGGSCGSQKAGTIRISHRQLRTLFLFVCLTPISALRFISCIIITSDTTLDRPPPCLQVSGV